MVIDYFTDKNAAAAAYNAVAHNSHVILLGPVDFVDAPAHVGRYEYPEDGPGEVYVLIEHISLAGVANFTIPKSATAT